MVDAREKLRAAVCKNPNEYEDFIRLERGKKKFL
jgi:hypothetical protein